ncbi:hypothetical protein ACFQV2_11475 [Actinokineospora soli]|uniref:Beta-mannosidase-like galactose-binding domain-containing protein n=1 Tax=Actinokineospora soli TaxID=1048753 RepID=A0ABW2TMN1_9PSEU
MPGCAHLDLLDAGLIEHPYRDRVEADLIWMHRAEWRYSTTFTALAPEPGSGSTSPSTGWTPSRPSRSTGTSSAARPTCTAPTASTSPPSSATPTS